MVNAAAVVAVEFVLLAVVCGILVRYYASPSVTLDVKASVFLSWLLGFAGILLLPYDIALTISGTERQASLTSAWSFIYWSTFALAWVLLPLQDAYHASGHFTARERAVEALRRNLVFYLACLVLGAAYVAYAIATKRGSAGQVCCAFVCRLVLLLGGRVCLLWE